MGFRSAQVGECLESRCVTRTNLQVECESVIHSVRQTDSV